MKQIPLKVTTIELADGSIQPLSYREYITGIMKTPMNPQEGIGIDEMYGSMRVLDALNEAVGDWFTLEDADYAFFQKKVRSARFMTVDASIVQFVKDVSEV